MKPPSVRELPTTTPRRGADTTWALLLMLVVAGFLGMWAGTQYLAHRLGYHDNLGPVVYCVPSQLDAYLLAIACACVVGALVLLTRSGWRRFAIPLALAAVALYALRLGPVYSPFQLIHWVRAYRGVGELAAIISDAQRVAVVTALFSMLGGVVFVGSRSRRTASSSHGSARWGDGAGPPGRRGLGNRPANRGQRSAPFHG